MNKKKLSIIVPTHGRIDLFKETLESLVNQTTKEFEVIVSDDSAKTEERAQIKKLVENTRSCGLDIKYVFTKPNLKQAKNTNQGLQHATCEYLRILHSDDILAAECIQKELEIIEKYPHLDFFYSDIIAFRDNNPIFNSNPQFKEIDIYDFWLREKIFTCTALPSSLVFKQDLFKQIGGLNEKMNFVCDWEFFFKMLLNSYFSGKKTGNFSKGLIGWRMHENSTTGKMALVHFSEYKMLMKMFNKCYKKYHLLNKAELKQANIIMQDYRYKRLVCDYNQYHNFKMPNIPIRYLCTNEKWFIKRDKLIKHINYFTTPIKSFLRWMSEPVSIVFYAIKFLLQTTKELARIKKDLK